MPSRDMTIWLLALAALGATASGQERNFSQHEIWGERPDPQVAAARLALALPSPDATLGTAWDPPPTALSSEGEEGAVPLQILPTESGMSDEWPSGGIEQKEATWRDYLGQRGIPRLPAAGWRQRPVSAGAFFGAAVDDDLSSGSIGGVRLGWDVDDHYGFEVRYALSDPEITSAGGLAEDDESHFLDVSALYYPLGENRWRPYVGVGLGLASYHFQDEALNIPLSAGVKYLVSPQLVLRLDAVENFTFDSNGGETNRLYLLGSLEYRFGGPRALWESDP